MFCFDLEYPQNACFEVLITNRGTLGSGTLENIRKVLRGTLENIRKLDHWDMPLKEI